MTHYTIVDSPIGKLTLTAERNALTAVRFARTDGTATLDAAWQRDDAHPVLAQARAQLEEYFAGKRTRFELPLAPAGTAFQRAVWDALLGVPFGATSTYGALAAQVGRPKAARAVGGAVGDNPIAVVIPCHRIIGKDGSLTGFGGGLPRKTILLQFEGVLLS
jgi:methylated-DNA-[protein]-cysteine S-methyltransferase